MQTIFVQLKCELGVAYEVAGKLVEQEGVSEVYSISGSTTYWRNAIWQMIRTLAGLLPMIFKSWRVLEKPIQQSLLMLSLNWITKENLVTSP